MNISFNKIIGTAAIVLVLWFVFVCCGSVNDGQEEERDFRQDMRNFVQNISVYTKRIMADFVVIPQNGHQLVSQYADTLVPADAYLSAIDGLGREDLFYGYGNDDEPTPLSEQLEMMSYLDLAAAHGVQALVTDYCSTRSYVNDSYAKNATRGYISFAADHRELDNIPHYPVEPYNVNVSDVTSLAGAKNFLYLLDPSTFGTKAAFLGAIQRTNYDILIMDLFFEETEALTSFDVDALKVKANGGKRLAVAYLSIGEAEDYRYYWNPTWNASPPSWLLKENPDWPGNYKVHYWDPAWQSIIYGNDSSYLKRIIDAGFDGVYLDLIDAFEYFEDQNVRAAQVGDQIFRLKSKRMILPHLASNNPEVLRFSRNKPFVSSPPPLPGCLPRAKVLSPQEVKVEIPRDVVEYYKLNLAEFLESASAVPHYKKDRAQRVIEGFEIRNIKKDAIVDQLGIKNGDVIVEANGIKIDSLERSISAYQGALAINQVDLTILRNGQKIRIKLRLK